MKDTEKTQDNSIDEAGRSRDRTEDVDERESDRGGNPPDLPGPHDFMRLMTDALPVSISYADSSERYRFANRTYKQWFNVTEAEIYGKRLEEALGSNWYKVVKEYVERALSGEVVRCDLNVPHTDGGVRQLEALLVPDIRAEGDVRGYLAIIQDLTERKRAEEAFRLDEARLEALVELYRMAEEPVQRLTEFALEKAIELSGSELGYVGLTGDNETELLIYAWIHAPGEHAGTLDKPLRCSVRPSEPWADAVRNKQTVLENQVLSPAGFMEGFPAGSVEVLRWLSVPVFDGPRLAAVVGVANKKSDYDKSDVRQLTLLMQGAWTLIHRRQAEDALRFSEARLRAIFESARDFVFIKDRDLRYTHVNPAMESIMGLDADHIIGRRAEDFFDSEAISHIRAIDLRILDGQTVEDEHTRVIQGERRTIHETKVPLRNERGEIIGICGIARDITERKKLVPETAVTESDFPSPAMRATMEKVGYAAATDGNVLLLGESGTGKDYLAAWIHEHSRRANGPFFAINCAAVSGELAESELFGHEPGAFTGARGRKRGLLELAEGGTLLLNEVGELPLPLQAKLLTFLDTRSFLRVGGEKSVYVNGRIISATHRDLEREVAEKRFLQPLFYRLNVFSVEVPPLRERREDIPIIAREIVERLAVEMQHSEVPPIDPASLKALARYHWPGNVRELRNLIERAFMLWEGGPLNVFAPPGEQSPEGWSHTLRFAPGQNLRDVVDEAVESLCESVLRSSGGNIKRTAQILGISRAALYRYMKRLNLQKTED